MIPRGQVCRRLPAGAPLAGFCPYCGHVNALHTRDRGCAGCEAVAAAMRVAAEVTRDAFERGGRATLQALTAALHTAHTLTGDPPSYELVLDLIRSSTEALTADSGGERHEKGEHVGKNDEKDDQPKVEVPTNSKPGLRKIRDETDPNNPKNKKQDNGEDGKG